MKTLNHPITALLALAGFLWLGWYSQQAEVGYTDSQRAGMARLVASALKPGKSLTAENAVKMVWLYDDNGQVK